MQYLGALLLLPLLSCQATSTDGGDGEGKLPREYLCGRAATPPVLDGMLDDPCWQAAPATKPFADISGLDHPAPRHETRAKMVWDDRCLYVGAWLDEPHVQATLKERDSVIYQDNDFELFLDPDGDTHLYTELEINAFGTEWDLLLVKPYLEGGPALNGFDLPGLETAVHVDGTINDPSDTDRGWGVEIAIPWAALDETTTSPTPPGPGDRWKVNFSRVEWTTRIEGSEYVKQTDPATGKPLPEDNWVWSPQGVVNMHIPERWGVVVFTDSHRAKGS
ncbi:MAG: carbohydrate-binding family 9-like protein [Planctomycetota bacterium]